ncbi:M4 family metallopeptidase [Veronia pacifica]|uniref:Peptidase M4 family protein n=1 Tax=Veronia pacifica TaxID=1080227 RepID=A0A1C3E7Z2_9GAMM|nr:M4 family metallopeptidase [Veronia pacifica]ODA29344.1 hypothetical protein A8L45_22370 [Veronia pacifica]
MKKGNGFTLSAIAGGITYGLLMASQAQAAESITLNHVDLDNKGNVSLFSSTTPQSKIANALGLPADVGFTVKRTMKDARGNTHTRMQQTFQGIPVWNGEAILHGTAQKNTLTGKVYTGFSQSRHLMRLTSAQNVSQEVERFLNQKYGETGRKLIDLRAKMYVFVDENGKDQLVYHVDLITETTPGTPSRPMLLLNASDLSVVKYWEGLAHSEEHQHDHQENAGHEHHRHDQHGHDHQQLSAWAQLLAKGPGGNTKTGRYVYGEDYESLTITREGETCYLESPNVRTVDMEHKYDLSKDDAFSFSCLDGEEPINNQREVNEAYSPLNDAFYFGNVSFNMYKDWYDTSPLPFQLMMKVHFGEDFENAFWNGRFMTFGDGKDYFYPLVDINVATHEVSHGFTEFNSGLIYANESGGMNEAFSDISAEGSEFYWKGDVDWIVGADIFKAEGGLRYFEDPTEDGRSIGHYDDYYDGMNVHFSSGIFNRAYYLLANSSGWDPRKALDVYVLANQAYWTADSTFEEGACGVISSAYDLGYDWQVVFKSFLEVGVVCTNTGVDTDYDGLDDGYEIKHGFNPFNSNDAQKDFDNDGLSNLAEAGINTDPKNADSDRDELTDGDEDKLGYNLLSSDSDSDGIDDHFENEMGLNPLDSSDALLDADNDGVINLTEYQGGSDLFDDMSIPALGRGFLFDFEEGAVPEEWGAAAGPKVFEITGENTIGNFSVVSQEIDHNSTVFNYIVLNGQGGMLSFDVKTSTEEGYDFFELAVDGDILYRASGEKDYHRVEVNVPEGSGVVTFSYTKDGGAIGGEDKVWLDNIQLETGYVDTDNDGMDDRWERVNGLNSSDPSDAC